MQKEMGVTGGGDGSRIPAFGGRNSRGQGRAESWKRPFCTGTGLIIGGLEKTTAGGSPAGWQSGGPGAERPTLESPAQPGGCGRMGCIRNEPFRGCPRQNRGLNWGGGGDLSRQQWAEATLKVGETPQGKGPEQGPLSPLPTAILQRPPWR